MEENKRSPLLVNSLFKVMDNVSLPASTSGLTLMEVLVVPYRPGNISLADRYEALLTRSRGLRFIDVDRPLLKAAAQLRAALKLKPPDAIQVAAAIMSNCSSFLTKDP